MKKTSYLRLIADDKELLEELKQVRAEMRKQAQREKEDEEYLREKHGKKLTRTTSS